MKALGLYLLFLLLSIAALVAIDKNIQTVIPQSNGLTEAEAYKLLYENQVKANDAISKTIYYALTGLASATLLVFASNWWFNDKKVKDIIAESERKSSELKASIASELHGKQQEFEAKINEKIASYKEDIAANINTRLSEFRTEFEQFRNSQSAAADTKFNTITATVQQQIASLEKFTEERYDLSKTYSDMKSAELQALITSSVEKVETKLRNEARAIRVSVLEQEGKLAFSQSRFNPAFTAYTAAFAIRLKQEDFQIPEYRFQPLLESLKKVSYVWEDEFRDLQTLFEKCTFEKPSQKTEAQKELSVKEVKYFPKD